MSYSKKHDRPFAPEIYSVGPVNIAVQHNEKDNLIDIKYYATMTLTAAFQFNNMLDWAVSQLPWVKHIAISICSYGGSGMAVVAMINKLVMYKMMGYTISTIVVGGAYSAGAILSIVGASPGRKYIAPYSILMIHQVQSFIHGNPEDVKSRQKDLKLSMNQIIKLIKDVGIDSGYVDELFAHSDWYFSPQQAVDKKLADKVSRSIPRIA